MNGAAGKIFTIVFSWLRGLLNGVWSLVRGAGGWLTDFLTEHWLIVLSVLLIGGLVVDLMVYLFRWRPYFLLRRRKPEKPVPAGDERWEDASAWRDESYPPEEAEDVYEDEAFLAAQDEYDALIAQTRRAPVASVSADPYLPQETRVNNALRSPYARGTLEEEKQSYQQLVADVPSTFGRAQPEPQMYYRDMQAGYAPELPPEELYAPAPADDSPVHPGLDDQVFHQSLGLDASGAPEEKQTVFRESGYVPYYQKSEQRAESKPLHGLRQLARRANLLADEDGQNAPSIRDLQPAKDLRSAFHAPVYPKNYQRPEE